MLGLLTVVAGPDRGRTFLVKEGVPLLLGRGPACTVTLSDPQVSRSHCQVEALDGRVTFIDTGSVGGTYVNGERVPRGQLKPGDILTLGVTQLAFRWSDLDQQRTEPFLDEKEGPDAPRRDLGSGG
jgi:pSer/pThr/pTyr-binding forkhead associated (FHA) protein